MFSLRVFAQLLQAWSPVEALPPFEAWASGALPYWVLVICQVLIIIACARVIWRLSRGLIMPSVATGKFLLSLGGIYFGLMCLRLIIGLTVATGHYWFSARLPTFFHLLLAGFMSGVSMRRSRHTWSRRHETDRSIWGLSCHPAR